MRHSSLAMLFAASLLIGGVEAQAQSAPVDGDYQFVVDLGAGGMAMPKYPGADQYIFAPFPIIQVGRFYLPGIGQRESSQSGFFLYPSFGFNGERKPSDDSSLKGTKKVPWTLELGLGAGVRNDWMRAFAEVRQGINGSDGQVGGLGFEVIVPVTSRIEFAAGPRADFASTDYMKTYFGVTAKEASKGSLSKYNPDGGFMSAGLTARASYALTEKTHLHVKGSWNHFIGDAAKSPIVKAGSKDQWTIGLGISHKFSFDLFR